MSTLQRAGAPIADLVDDSLDEATFLWRRWESELTSLTRNLDEIWSWTEDRLQGALDGVRVAGSQVIDIATEALLSKEIDRIAVGAGVLASSPERGAVDAIVAALAVADEPKLHAMVRALELLGSDECVRAAASVLAAGGPAHAGALCRVKAFRRVAAGDEMRTAFESNIPAAQIDALRAASLLPSPHAEAWVAAGLRSEHLDVRAAAAEIGVCRRMNEAWEAATRRARRLDVHAGRYLKLLALLGTAEDHEVVYGALRIPELQLPAIWALGHIGTVRAAEACLAGMQHEQLARACGETYCWITGADLARDRLAVVETPPDVPAFEDDDLDANLVPPPEALWPLPDVEAVRQHWDARKARFAENGRHVLGRPASPDTLMTTVETGPMLRRPDLVLELRARSRGRYDVEPRAFTGRQRRMMLAARAAFSSQGH